MSPRSEHLRRWREKNREKILAVKKRWRDENTEKNRGYRDAYTEKGSVHKESHYDPWIQEDVAKVLARAIPDQDLSKELGRTMRAIQSKRYLMTRKRRVKLS